MTWLTRFRVLSCAAIALALSACNALSGVGDLEFGAAGHGGASAGPTASSAGNVGSGGTKSAGCEGAAQALCAKLAACSPTTLQVLFGDETTCAARWALHCVAAVEAPGSNFGQAEASSCADALAGGDCEAMVGALGGCPPPPGDLADGAGCVFDAQCASSYCQSTADPACGIRFPRHKAGEACDVDETCEPGLACSEGLCAAVVGEGEACDAGRPCGWNLVCKGTCQPLPQVGEPCDTNDGCDELAGAFCLGMCIEVPVVPVGDNCADAVVFICAASGTCDVNGSKNCEPPANDGDHCGDAAGDPQCLFPAVCVAGLCVLPGDAVCP